MNHLIRKTITPIAIALSFLNFPILSILRLSDLIIIFLSLLNTRFYQLAIIFSAFFGFHFIISSKYGDINLFWYLKFLTTIAIFTVLNSYVKMELKNSIIFLKTSTLVFISWVYLKLFLVSNGVISGSLRVSFPTSNYNIVDSHLYAQVLTILGISYGMVAYLRSDLQRPNVFLLVLIGATWLLANILTSSRNGIAITVVVFIFLALLVIFNIFIRGKITKRYSKVFGFILFIILGFLILNFDLKKFGELYSLIERSLYSLSLTDASTSVRLRELHRVLYDADIWQFFVGNSIFNGKVGFYDGTLTLSLAIFGTLFTGCFVLLITLLLIYLLFFKKLYFTTGVIAIYCMQNLISEFIFVSRGAVFSFFAILVVFRAEQEVKTHKA